MEIVEPFALLDVLVLWKAELIVVPMSVAQVLVRSVLGWVGELVVQAQAHVQAQAQELVRPPIVVGPVLVERHQPVSILFLVIPHIILAF